MRRSMVGLLTGVALASSACHTMRPMTLDELGSVRPARVWVTRGDRSVLVVSGPQMLRGDLVGFVDGRFSQVPADDVKQMLVRRPARARTAVLIAAGAIGLAAFTVMMSGKGDVYDPRQQVDCEELPDHPLCY
jgi:hypothetical protein